MGYWKRFDILFGIFAWWEKCRLDKYYQIMNDYTIGVIKNRRKRLLQKKVQKLSSCVDQQCVIDILLQSTTDGKSMTDKEILDEVKTIMIAVNIIKLLLCKALFTLVRK